VLADGQLVALLGLALQVARAAPVAGDGRVRMMRLSAMTCATVSSRRIVTRCPANGLPTSIWVWPMEIWPQALTVR
jgi:hypothetical protein